MKATETWQRAIFILTLANFLLLLGILLTGCGQEQEAPQPIIVNVTAPETATEPPAVTEIPVVAEPPAVAVEEAPAVEEPEEDPEVAGLLEDTPCEAERSRRCPSLAQGRMNSAMKAWDNEKQELGNHEYLGALECLFILEQDHGWTTDETNEAFDEMFDTALSRYADDLDALERIADGLAAFRAWLKGEVDE